MVSSEYRFSEAHYSKLRRSLWTATILTLLFVAVFSWYSSRGREDNPTLTGGVLVFLIGVVGFSMYRAQKRQQAQARSFLLTLNGDTLVRVQDGFDPVTIKASDVLSIRSIPGQGLALRSPDGVTRLSIPETIERFTELKTALMAWCPVEEMTHPPLLVRYRWPAMIAAMGAMATLYLSENPAIVLPLGVALVLGLLLSFLQMRASHEIDKRTKKLVWVFLFGILQIVGRVIAVARLARLW